jgi:hypothetical protein
LASFYDLDIRLWICSDRIFFFFFFFSVHAI